MVAVSCVYVCYVSVNVNVSYVNLSLRVCGVGESAVTNTRDTARQRISLVFLR